MALIVVADDNPDILDLIELKLGAAGHSVVTAADGQQALVAVGTHHPDLVLLDLGMPRLTGLEVLAAMRADLTTRAIPVIVISAYSDGARTGECRRLGVTAFVGKPFSPRALAADVEAVLATGTSAGTSAGTSTDLAEAHSRGC